MLVSDFKLFYLAGFLLIVLGSAMIGIPEIIAVWFNHQKGDTVTEIVKALNWPYVFWFMGIGTLILFLAWFVFWHLPQEGIR